MTKDEYREDLRKRMEKLRKRKKVNYDDPENDPVLNLARDEDNEEYICYADNPYLSMQAKVSWMKGKNSGVAYCRNPLNLLVDEGSKSERYINWRANDDGHISFEPKHQTKTSRTLRILQKLKMLPQNKTPTILKQVWY